MIKQKLLLIAAVVVVVAAAAVTTVVLTSGSTKSAERCDIPKSVRQEPAAAKAAPDGGGIGVVEQGFSQTDAASVGAVLQNTSNRIAYRTRVALRVIVSSGTGPPKQALEGAQMTEEIPVIVPGQRVGIGRGLNLAPLRVSSITIDLLKTTWLPKGTLGGQFTPITTAHTSTTRSHVHPPADAVRYTENSANCRALTTRGTAVVFRDARGKIIGGDLAFPDGNGNGNPAASQQQPPSSPSCSPGERETWIVPFTDVPPNADDKRTQLYSYCDLNAPPSDVNKVF